MKYTKEILAPIVAASTSVAQVLKALNLRPSGGNYCHIARRIDLFKIDRTHFVGKGANRGDRHKCGVAKRGWKEILLKRDQGLREKPFKLRRALIEMDRIYRCEGAGCSIAAEWLGRPLVLHVNHKSGDWLDNRPENLELLCPNCHSQTDNWCGTKGLSDITHRNRAYRDLRQRRLRPRGGMADASVLGAGAREGVGVRISPGPLEEEA
jgi:hypothetical protein